MTVGPMVSGGHHGARWLQGAQQKAHGLQRAHRNDTEKSVCERSKTCCFFFEITPNSGENCDIFIEDLFFWRSHKIWRKLWHYPLLFWSTQNRRCLIFELTPGPCLALGAPASRPIGVARIIDGGGPKPQITCNKVIRNFERGIFCGGKNIVEWKIRSHGLVLARN